MPTIINDPILDRLQTELSENLQKAKTLRERAKSLDPLTGAERSLLRDLVKNSDQLLERVKARKDDLAAMHAVEEKFAGVLPGASGFTRRRSAKGRQVHPWAKALTSHLDTMRAKSLTPSGSVTVPALLPGLVDETPDRQTTFLSRINFRQLDDTDTFQYWRVEARAHNASTVEAGQTKPRSAYNREKVEDRVRTIAHLSDPIDRQDLADIDMLEEFISTEMVTGVRLELEHQVLLGEGSTAGILDDLDGILATSGVGAQAFATDRLVTARKCVTQLETLNIPLGSVAWVMHPDDWESYELMTGTSHFLLADPGTSGASLPIDRARRTLWGYPVDTSVLMTEGQALLGDWSPDSIEIHEREEVQIDWSEGAVVGFDTVEGESVARTGFERNQVTFRAEGRWGLAVKRPGAFITGDLTEGS